MTVMSVSAIIERIKSATPDEPVAVFRTEREGELGCIAFNTEKYYGQALVGLYDQTMDLVRIENYLESITR